MQLYIQLSETILYKNNQHQQQNGSNNWSVCIYQPRSQAPAQLPVACSTVKQYCKRREAGRGPGNEAMHILCRYIVASSPETGSANKTRPTGTPSSKYLSYFAQHAHSIYCPVLQFTTCRLFPHFFISPFFISHFPFLVPTFRVTHRQRSGLAPRVPDPTPHPLTRGWWARD